MATDRWVSPILTLKRFGNPNLLQVQYIPTEVVRASPAPLRVMYSFSSNFNQRNPQWQPKRLASSIVNYCNTMKKLILLLLVLSSLELSAQVDPIDSLALVDFYETLGGDDWTNNDGWLNGPVNTWVGVVLQDTRIFGINLPNNNLVGDVPGGITTIGSLREIIINNNRITSLPDFGTQSPLQKLIVNDNLLQDLPEIGIPILDELSCENNFLEFDDLEGFFPEVNVFNYSPQAPLGEPGFIYARPGDDLQLTVETEGFFNLYTWFLDDTQISGPSNVPELDLTSVNNSDEGTYTATVTNGAFPELTLLREPQELLLYDRDSLGGLYVPNHMIIVFTEDATDFEKDTLREFYQAKVLDDCLCRDIELWEIPDTSFLSDGNILVGVEETKESASTKSKVEDTGNNYILDLLEKAGKKKTRETLTPQFYLPTPPPPTIDPVVAIIDVGVDASHPDLSSFMWDNEDEVLNGMDNDDNCLADDIAGYDFVNSDTDPADLISGHGTHLAGIISANEATNLVKIMAVKSHADDGLGFLFEALCGIYYAGEQDAPIINLSWGYQGAPSSVLEESIRYFGEDCGTLFITSAGNDASDNDQTPHYPSSFELNNIISVAALDESESLLAPFTNFGIESVDIAAPGTRILSTVPGGGYDFRDGSSMAAAAVSHAAARIWQERPELTYVNIKNAILNSAAVLPALDQVATSGKLDLSAALMEAAGATVDTSCAIINNQFDLFEGDGLVRAYPQPFSSNFELQWPSGQEGDLEINIYNAFGQSVFQTTADANSTSINIQTRSWPAGLYYAHLRQGRRFNSIKILKQ